MKTIRRNGVLATLLLTSSLLATVPASSYAWHGGGWHGGGWHRGGWGVGAGVLGAGLLLTTPFFYNRYYNYNYCPTVRVCNMYGDCWLQQRCY